MKKQPVLFIVTFLLLLITSMPAQTECSPACKARSYKPAPETNQQINFSTEAFELVPVLLN